MAEHLNCQAIETFLNQIASISRPVAKTEKINDEPVKNGYTASFWDDKRGIGFTVIAWGDGHMKAYLETAGKIGQAEEFGAAMSRALTAT